MMKSGKDEEKEMDPLFPRLHINDTEKRGPKGPPRNKMAVYEQLSMHPSRVNYGSISVLPFPPKNSTNLVPSTSSSHDGSQERSVLSLFCNSPGSTRLSKKLHPYFSGAMNFETTLKNLELQPIELANYQTSNTSSQLGTTVQCNSLKPHKLSNPNNSSAKKLGDEDNYKVPTFGYQIMDKENRKKRSSLLDYLSRLADPNGQSYHGYKVIEENKALKNGTFAGPDKATRKRNASLMEDLSEDNTRRPNGLENVTGNQEGIDSGSPQVEVNENGDISDTSEVDSVLGLEISPDDVVGVMGQKLFWNTRRTIVLQQKVFAGQVFELHRLIMVQRTIAGSPELMLDDNLHVGKPSIQLSPTKKPPDENVLQPPPPPLIAKAKADFQILKSSNEDTSTRVTRKSDVPPPKSTAVDSKSDQKPQPKSIEPWCYQPPGNQWLVPVKSLSQGFMYKPYTGHLMEPVYGSCGPTALTLNGGEYLAPAYMGPTTLGQTYIAPYGIPFVGSHSTLPVRDINFTVPYQSSHNMLRQKSGLIRESDLKGSIGNSAPERGRRDPLPLFPIAPAVRITDQPDQNSGTLQRTPVIKVVPHNPKSASESAARIFKSIQEERKQYE